GRGLAAPGRGGAGGVPGGAGGARGAAVPALPSGAPPAVDRTVERVVQGHPPLRSQTPPSRPVSTTTTSHNRETSQRAPGLWLAGWTGVGALRGAGRSRYPQWGQ